MWKRRRADELETVNLLEMMPVRVAEWTESSGRIVVVRPKPVRVGFLGMIDHMLYLLSAKRIRLDAEGSFAWLNLDGEHTVGQLAALMREEFGEKVEPAEERLGQLVRVFRREGFVAYPGWDDGVLAKRSPAGQAP